MGESSAKKAAYQPFSPIRPLIHRCGGPPSPEGKVGGQPRVAFSIEVCYTAFTDVFPDFLGKRQFFKGSTA